MRKVAAALRADEAVNGARPTETTVAAPRNDVIVTVPGRHPTAVESRSVRSSGLTRIVSSA